MDELTSVYIQECREQLADMEAGLLRLEQAPEDRDNLNGIFRAAHTIKGGAGVIECRYIEHFTHGVENLLDKFYYQPTGGAYIGQGRTMSLGGTTNTWASTSAPPAGYAVPGMGRSFYLGMNVKF